MTANEFLMRPTVLRKAIISASEQRDRLRAKAESKSISYGGEHSEPSGNRTEELMFRIAAFDFEIDVLEEQCRLAVSQTKKAIRSIDDLRLAKVLELHYIDGMTYRMIAHEMSYSVSRIKQLSREAKEKIVPFIP